MSLQGEAQKDLPNENKGFKRFIKFTDKIEEAGAVNVGRERKGQKMTLDGGGSVGSPSGK